MSPSRETARSVALAAAILLVPAPALAHAAGPEVDAVGVPLAGALLIYLLGWLRATRRPLLRDTACYLAGWTILALAATGPLHRLAHDSAALHMVQHMVLLTLVPPLLLLARPMPVLLRALPQPLRRSGLRFAGAVHARAAETGAAAFLVHGAAIWLFHLPGPYRAAMESAALHHLSHAAFLLSALWFWHTLTAPARLGRPGLLRASVYAVLTVMHTGMLGAILTFAAAPLYPDHPTAALALDPLADQQLAGLVMWVPGGLVYSAAALALWLVWMRRQERAGAHGSKPAAHV